MLKIFLVTAPGIERGSREQIARFVTGWEAEHVAKSLYREWRERPEKLWMVASGKRAWEAETKALRVDAWRNLGAD